MWHDLEHQYDKTTFSKDKLTSEASSKYLGVELQSDMSWRSHIDKIVKKANSTLRFLNSNSLLIRNPTKDCHQQQYNQQTYTKDETIKNEK